MKRIIHDEAKRELREATEYYAAISPELGIQFYNEMARLIGEVCTYPELFRQFDPPARRHFSQRFPYGVIYLVEPNHVWIVTIMQLNREPTYWKQRTAKS